jgi:thiamine pyrophosphate-dependent acetolactate synthase large subunit-like protein
MTERERADADSGSLIDGNQIIARCLRELDVEVIFFLMGGPMLDCESACAGKGIRLIDVRHEQAAVMMATAYSRMLRRPSVCMAASGPGVTNLVTGIAHAHVDGAPVIAIGGAAAQANANTQTFQELDQVALFEPITRWAARCRDTVQLPQFIHWAFQHAFGSHPGPVYLDIPADVLYRKVPEHDVRWVKSAGIRPRPHPAASDVDRAVELIAASRRPCLIYGSGALWSQADDALRSFVERADIPFFATPQGRGMIDEDHELSFLGARSTAFRECDLIVQVATRQNYVIDHLRAPRWNADARLIQIDIDQIEIGLNREPDVALVADARAALQDLTQRLDARKISCDHSAWRAELGSEHQAKLAGGDKLASDGTVPMHPLRLCRAVRDALPADAVLVVDGQEILNYARQSIPFHRPHSLNSGPFGTMGVGLPMAIGAKIALPGAVVVVLHGDGSFGLNAMEMDTALRFGIPVVCVISNNGGWTANTPSQAGAGPKPGRDLGHTRYDLMFASIGAHTSYVEDADRLEGALADAIASGRPALINVMTDPSARAGGAVFTRYAT